MDDQLNKHTSGALEAELRARNSTLTVNDAKLAVARVFDSLKALTDRGEDVRITKFGTFKKKTRAGRSGRNPFNGESYQTSDKEVLTFKPAKDA